MPLSGKPWVKAASKAWRWQSTKLFFAKRVSPEMILPQYTPGIVTSNHINGDPEQNAGQEILRSRKRKIQADHYDSTAKTQKVMFHKSLSLEKSWLIFE